MQFVDQSFDADGTITQWEWDFGDGSRASGPMVTHTYSSAGPYNVRLTVTDNCGASSSVIQTITVQSGTDGGTPSCPPLDIRVWLDRTTFQIGEEVAVHMHFNQPVLATLTVRIVATGQVRTVFSNQFFGAGTHDFRAVIGHPEGERIMTLTAVNPCGQVATATFAYRAWGPAPPIRGPG
ncbi:MAG: PKD domain-containing protein [Candidatus Bipolaricaulaceae bacterium]